MDKTRTRSAAESWYGEPLEQVEMLFIENILETPLLLRYLNTYRFNVQRAANLLKFGFNLRKNHLNIFTNRDFLAPEIVKALEVW
jgi:hypothetical protein